MMAILTGVKCYLVVILISISLMASDSDHLFICLWALYSFPLIYVSVLVPVPDCFETVALQYSLISGIVINPTLFFFIKIAAALAKMEA